MDYKEPVFLGVCDNSLLRILNWGMFITFIFCVCFPCGIGALDKRCVVTVHDEYVTDFCSVLFVLFYFFVSTRWLCRGRRETCLYKERFVWETRRSPEIVVLL